MITIIILCISHNIIILLITRLLVQNSLTQLPHHQRICYARLYRYINNLVYPCWDSKMNGADFAKMFIRMYCRFVWQQPLLATRQCA